MIDQISFKGLPPQTRKITPKLIIGAKQGLTGLRELKKEGVNLVIDVRKKRLFSSTIEKILCKIVGIPRIEVPTTLGKFTSTFETFKKAAEFISKNKNGKTFLHCKKGEHRSVIVAAITQIKDGKIKTKGDLTKFLEENNFFKVSKKGLLSKIFSSYNEKSKRKNLYKLKEHFAYYFLV